MKLLLTGSRRSLRPRCCHQKCAGRRSYDYFQDADKVVHDQDLTQDVWNDSNAPHGTEASYIKASLEENLTVASLYDSTPIIISNIIYASKVS